MRGPRPLLPVLCICAGLGAMSFSSTAQAATRPGKPALTASPGEAKTLVAAEAPFECGTYKGNESEHKWRQAVHLRNQQQIANGSKSVKTTGLDYVYNDVWVIEDDGTLVLAGTNLFDTDNQTHQYSPSGSTYTISSITPSWDVNQGTTILPGDDGAVAVTLPFSFSIGGASYTQMAVSGNGAVAFGGVLNPNGYYDNADFFNAVRKIAGLYLDLNPAAGGTVKVKSEATKYTITWNGVPEYGTAKLNNVQIVLYPSGIFTITYNVIASTTQNNGFPVIIGFHPGGDPPLQEINFSTLPFVSNPGASVYEQYYSYPNPLVDEVALMNRFYSQFPDEFFQIVFFTNFTQTMGGFANELNIKNDVTGIGLGIFDASAQYGSSGVLESRCNMNRINAWPSADPAARVLSKGNNFLTIMGQEAGHRWGAFTYFNNGGGPSNLILGRSDAHWSYYVDVDHSSLEGGDWTSMGGSNYECQTNIDFFSEVDEYAFGLRNKDEVKDFFYISSPSNNLPGNRSVGTPIFGATATGTFVPVTVEHIIAAEGLRTPLEPAENKDLRQAFIFLILQGTVPDQAQLDKVAGYRAAWESYFEKSCDGRLAVNTSLAQNFPVAVVCGTVRDETTTLPIPDFTATSIQRGFVQHVADGGRFIFRYMDDPAPATSEAVTIAFSATGYQPDTLMLNVNYGTTYCNQQVFLLPIPTAAGDGPKMTTELFENHPNPFNPSTQIAYRLASGGRVTLTIFDAKGVKVRTLVEGEHSAGPHDVTFDGRDDQGRSLASGVYFYKLQTADVARTRKMVLLK